ncbi:hypothetical protein BO70DRAFT_393050 [Aspergillus heteromorphus CBS 117.55]|uniref:CPAF-like PDZ domain-containing protein n=1 Tax=Aspergillus heteromorphus CBS 117.55 TaxID=1448321 RepID=A0A317WYP5_9EURO|nr:uncharacterized protein BO70DRAFT_393050 [Aspergillus heteromorphus CBS 117.55]PWY89848.1 hypothetical protein BO70DRAFT_393050 [Aspergillus heteromorphus CBS 117.55]
MPWRDLNSTGYQEPSTGPFSVDGKLAADCLQSIPFDARKGTQFVDEFRKFVEWQSTLDVLKNPPSEYLSPATDILGGLDQTQAQAAQSSYDSQTLLYIPLPFFDRPEPGVCLEGRTSSPANIRRRNDAQLLSQGVDNVSAVVTINDRLAVDVLEEFASSQSFQDPDARYRQLFYCPGREVTGNDARGAFAAPSLWPEWTQYEIQFANGTSIQTDIVASLASTFGVFDYTTGRSLLEDKCLVSMSPTNTSSPTPSPSPSPSATATPSPHPPCTPSP